ncbi:MAG: MATE family efflux transporter [Paracoccus denitrificans]|nr:MAG: MATE family efflux transporter [Paracoccus denitrificans]PZO84648.1 MAG: MATE family efflux transporter [Paracoccus denitrificans]
MTISSIIVGNTLGTSELAAVSAFFPVAFFFIAFLIGLSSGASVLVGQAYGAGKMDMVRRIAGTTMTVAVVLGMVIGIGGSILAQPIMMLLRTPADIMQSAVSYARIAFLIMPILFMFITAGALMRGIRDSIRPLIMQVISTAGTALLTFVLIARLGYHVEGAAIGQGIAQLVGLILLGVWLRWLGHPLAPDAAFIRLLKPDFTLLKTVLRIGMPTGVQLVIGSLSGLVILGLVNSFGSSATAAFGAVAQVQNYAQFPALSIAIAGSIFGAQAIGAGRADRLGDVVRTAMLMNVILTGGLVAFIYLASRPLVSLFITDPETLDLAERLLHIVSWSALMFGTGTIFSGIMRASGTVIPPMVIAIACIVLVELPLAVYLSRQVGLDGIWWAYCASFGALMLLQGLYYNFVWRKKRIESLV